MNVGQLKADLGEPVDWLDQYDVLPVLVWADGRWMTVSAVLKNGERVILSLEPYDPWPDDLRGKRPTPLQGWEEPELPLT